jgi:hypothetical protein
MTVLKRIFGPKRDEVMGEWRKLHSEVLHHLYSSPNIIRQIKTKRMMWVRHGRGEKSVQDLGGEAQRKEITWMIKAEMQAWDQNGP